MKGDWRLEAGIADSRGGASSGSPSAQRRRQTVLRGAGGATGYFVRFPFVFLPSWDWRVAEKRPEQGGGSETKLRIYPILLG